jgi:RNA polymerase sigma factor (sigma-70 family)
MMGDLRPNLDISGTDSPQSTYPSMQRETAQRSEVLGETEGQIIARHEGRIRHMAIPFADRGVSLDDLMQEGRIALILASRSWSPSGGATLWTYAYKFVYGAISRSKTKEIEEPCHTQALAGHDEHACSNGGNSAFSDDVTGGVENIGEDVPNAEETIATAQLVSIASGEMICLSEQERRVVRMRLNDDRDVRAIAVELGLSKSDVDRIYHGAIGKLRERVGARV